MEAMHPASYVGKDVALPCSLPAPLPSPTQILWGLLWRPSHRHDRLLTQFPVPLQRMAGAAENFQLFNHNLVFLLTSPHPGATKSHLIRTKKIPITQEILGFGAQCLGGSLIYGISFYLQVVSELS